MAVQSTSRDMTSYEPNTNQALSLPMEINSLADAFVQSGFFADTKQKAQAIVKILYGQELGIGPVASMLNIHVIEGKPAMGSNLMAAIVKRSGKYDFTVDAHTSTECMLSFYNGPGTRKLGQSHFTMEDAKRAGVAGRQNWQRYPKAMLFARALSQGARMYCADIFLGAIYEPEELREVERSKPTMVTIPTSEPTNLTAPPPAYDDLFVEGEVVEGVEEAPDFLADPETGEVALSSEEMYARYRVAKKTAVLNHMELDFADAVKGVALRRQDGSITPFEESPPPVQYAIMLAAEEVVESIS